MPGKYWWAMYSWFIDNYNHEPSDDTDDEDDEDTDDDDDSDTDDDTDTDDDDDDEDDDGSDFYQCIRDTISRQLVKSLALALLLRWLAFVLLFILYWTTRSFGMWFEMYNLYISYQCMDIAQCYCNGAFVNYVDSKNRIRWDMLRMSCAGSACVYLHIVPPHVVVFWVMVSTTFNESTPLMEDIYPSDDDEGEDPDYH
jgi:hypothetical protein